jgi:peptidyl-prolyl cis-trans isomerase D
MSVIQSIREKYAKWAVVAIALALLGFILTDYLSTRNRMFGGSNSTVIGSVNGKKIEYIEFENRLKNIEAQARSQGQQLGEMERHQNIERLWSQEVEQIIMNAEFDKAGIAVGKKELNEWLFGSNPPQDLKQRFTNEQGQYDAAAAQRAINQLKRSANQSDRDQLNIYLAAIEYSRQAEKYNALLTNSVYYPKWYIEKQNADESAVAKVAYAVYTYTRIMDSTVSVSDKEIEEYINKHKDQYKQEESRSISYIVFSASPTAQDTAAIKSQVAALKPEFETAKDPAAFLARFGSAMEYFDGYNGKSQIQVPAKDSIFALAKNKVYGPYIDNGSVVLAKLIDVKPLPDSVKARHILIQTYDPQSGQQTLADSVAKKRIDSIANAILKGSASFDSLAKKYSDDKGSAVKGGLLSNPSNPQTNYFTNGQMVKEFNDFCFEGKKGEKKVVKTVFGYHFIEILDQKNFQPHYKVAYFAKNIVASDETDRAALSAASKFASESRDALAFQENYEKTLKPQGYQILVATNIKPTDNLIEGISAYGTSRQLVRDIYKAKRGEVLPQHRVGDKYIVAAVTEIYKEGTMSPAVARLTVEPILKNKKKAEIIKKKIGKPTTLEAAAAIIQTGVTTIDSLRFNGGQLGFEPRVTGAAFNPSYKGKLIPEPLEGVSGVYVLRIDDLSSTSITTGSVAEQQKQLRDKAKQMAAFYNQPIQVLRKSARIKDNRTTFY